MKLWIPLMMAVSVVSMNAFANLDQPRPDPMMKKFTCYSKDGYGFRYGATGYLPRATQNEAHRLCEIRSHGPCVDQGCKPN